MTKGLCSASACLSSLFPSGIVPQTFIFFTWMFLKIIGQQFCRMLLNQICLMSLHDQTLVVYFCQEQHRSNAVFFSLYPICQYAMLTCSIVGGLNFDHQNKIVNIRILHCKTVFACFYFVNNKCFLWKYLRLNKYPFPHFTFTQQFQKSLLFHV